MNNILKCDLCGADAGDDPYHVTMDGNGHVHICASCFDPQQHDVAVLKQQCDDLLAQQNELQKQIKELQCKLGGCGVAAMQNTRHTIARRIAPGEYGYSMSYAAVCRAVDREIALREQRDELLDVVREFVQTMDSLPDSNETSLRVWDVYDTASKLIERMQRGES